MKNNTLVYADLQKQEIGPFIVSLDTMGTVEDLKKNNITLSEGMTIWCWGDDEPGDPFIFPLKLSFNKEVNKWVGEYNPDDLMHYSDYVKKGDTTWDEAVSKI